MVLGGIIADHWGWRAAFGAVGFPGLVMALLFLLVPDYKNVIVKMRPAVKSSDTKAYLHRMYGTLSRGKTLLLVCIAGSFQLIVVSTMWSSVPSFLNRYHGMTASTAAKNAGVLVLCGAVGAVFWGGVADRLARRRSAYKLMMLVGTTSATAALFIFAFSVPLSPSIQYPLILLGGFMTTCTVGVGQRRAGCDAPGAASYRQRRACLRHQPVRPGGWPPSCAAGAAA